MNKQGDILLVSKNELEQILRKLLEQGIVVIPLKQRYRKLFFGDKELSVIDPHVENVVITMNDLKVNIFNNK